MNYGISYAEECSNFNSLNVLALFSYHQIANTAQLSEPLVMAKWSEQG